MRYSKCDDINSLVKDLVHQGWCFSRGKKHGKLVHPSGQHFLTVSKTPSDWRAYRNFLNCLRHVQWRGEKSVSNSRGWWCPGI